MSPGFVLATCPGRAVGSAKLTVCALRSLLRWLQLTGVIATPQQRLLHHVLGFGDALDRDAVCATVTAAKPDVVVHQLTALAGPADLRRFDAYFAATNRLRTQGTDNLLAAA